MSQEEVVRKVTKILEEKSIPYMLTGAIAVNFYGRPRFTHDVDIVIKITEKNISDLVSALEKEFYVNKDEIEEAISHQRQFNIIYLKDTLLKVDFWINRTDEYSLTQFSRRKKNLIFGQEIFLISAEDLILSKLLWYKDSESEKHLLDAQSVYELQAEKLDSDYLSLWAERIFVKNLLEKISKKL